MDCGNCPFINHVFKGGQPALDEHADKPNNVTCSSNKVANVKAECNNKEVFLDRRKLHFDILFGGIEISYSSLTGLFRMFLGLIGKLIIQGIDNATPGYLKRVVSYVWSYIPAFKSEQIPKTNSIILRTVEGKNSLKSYIIVEKENEKDSNYISGSILNIAQQNIHSGQYILRDEEEEEDVNEILHNDRTQEDLSSEKESHEHETSHQTEMSVHVKSEASPRSLRKVQSFPEEKKVAVSREREYQDEPEVLEKLKKLDDIKKDAERWAEEIVKFDGNERKFLHIQEMLLRDIDATDLIYANGKDVIKQTKKDIITFVQEELDKLEAKNKNTRNGT